MKTMISWQEEARDEHDQLNRPVASAPLHRTVMRWRDGIFRTNRGLSFMRVLLRGSRPKTGALNVRAFESTHKAWAHAVYTHATALRSYSLCLWPSDLPPNNVTDRVIPPLGPRPLPLRLACPLHRDINPCRRNIPLTKRPDGHDIQITVSRGTFGAACSIHVVRLSERGEQAAAADVEAWAYLNAHHGGLRLRQSLVAADRESMPTGPSLLAPFQAEMLTFSSSVASCLNSCRASLLHVRRREGRQT